MVFFLKDTKDFPAVRGGVTRMDPHSKLFRLLADLGYGCSLDSAWLHMSMMADGEPYIRCFKISDPRAGYALSWSAAYTETWAEAHHNRTWPSRGGAIYSSVCIADPCLSGQSRFHAVSSSVIIHVKRRLAGEIRAARPWDEMMDDNVNENVKRVSTTAGSFYPSLC